MLKFLCESSLISPFMVLGSHTGCYTVQPLVWRIISWTFPKRFDVALGEYWIVRTVGSLEDGHMCLCCEVLMSFGGGVKGRMLGLNFNLKKKALHRLPLMAWVSSRTSHRLVTTPISAPPIYPNTFYRQDNCRLEIICLGWCLSASAGTLAWL